MLSENQLNDIFKSENIKAFICSIIFSVGIFFFTNISFAEIPQTPTPTPADNTGVSTDINTTGNQKQAVPATQAKDSRQSTNTSSGIISETATPPAKVAPAVIAVPVAAAIADDVKKKASKDAPSVENNEKGTAKEQDKDKIDPVKNTEKNSIQPEAAVLAPAIIAAPAAVAIADETEKKAEKDTGKNTNDKNEKTDSAKETKAESLTATQNPMFTVTNNTDVSSVEAPGIINYTIVIENTGNLPLTKIRLSDPLLDSLNGPDKDTDTPWELDVDETWTYSGIYQVTQEIIDRNGVNENNEIDGGGNIKTSVSVDFAETEAQSAGTSVEIIQKPEYKVKKEADISSINEPDTINYVITIENTGNVSLTQISISDPLIEDLDGPEGDENNPGVLGVNEIWTYEGSYTVSQEVIDANGMDANNELDSDGDIDNTVMIDFAETDTPQTAHVSVVTEPITGDIFEKKHRNIHAFLSVNQSYTTNLYKTDRNPDDCWATTITPGIWATYPSNMKRSIEIITQNSSPGGLAIEPFKPSFFKRFQAYFLYSPQLAMYHGQGGKAYQDPDLGGGIIDNDDVDQAGDEVREFTDSQDSVDRLTHRFDGMLHYHSGNRLSVRAIDQYKISYDAFSERAYFTDDKYTSNMFNLGGTYDLTEKLQLRLDYSNFYLNYEDDFNADADRMDNVYAAFAFFKITSKTSVFLEYDFADIGYDSSTKDSHEHRYFAGLRWEMTGKSSGQIKGGFGRKKTTDSPMIDTDVDISDISEETWIAAIQIDHNLTSKTNLTFNAYRRYDEVLEHRYDYGNLEKFYADYVLAHFAGLKFSWKIIPILQLNLDTSLFYDEFKESQLVNRQGDIADREDWEFAVSPSVTVSLWEHCSINGAYIYTDHDSNYNGHDYIDHTFFVRGSVFF